MTLFADWTPVRLLKFSFAVEGNLKSASFVRASTTVSLRQAPRKLPAQRDALTARAAPGSAVERRDGGQGVPTTSHNRARVSGRPRSDRVSGPPRPSKGPHAHVDGRALQRC